MDKEERRKYIYSQLGSLPNATQYVEVTKYIEDLEQQIKKQQQAIDKANKYLHTRGIQKCYNGRHYRGLDGLQVQVLEDILKEVSE